MVVITAGIADIALPKTGPPTNVFGFETVGRRHAPYVDDIRTCTIEPDALQGTLAVAAHTAIWYISSVMKVDRETLQVERLHGDADASDRAYWSARSPLERLRAVQSDRQVAYGRASASRRLQRVLEVAERR